MICVTHLVLALATAAPATGMAKELAGYRAFKFGMDRAAIERVAAITCGPASRLDVVECRATGAKIVDTPSEVLLSLYRGRLYNVVVRLVFSASQGSSDRRGRYLELMDLLKHKYGTPSEEEHNMRAGTAGVGEGATWWGPTKRSRLWALAFTDDGGMWVRIGYTDQATLDVIEARERDLEAERKAAAAKDL